MKVLIEVEVFTIYEMNDEQIVLALHECRSGSLEAFGYGLAVERDDSVDSEAHKKAFIEEQRKDGSLFQANGRWFKSGEHIYYRASDDTQYRVID